MSLAPHISGQLFFAATVECSTYVVRYEGLVAELRSTCHNSKINDVVRPRSAQMVHDSRR